MKTDGTPLKFEDLLSALRNARKKGLGKPYEVEFTRDEYIACLVNDLGRTKEEAVKAYERCRRPDGTVLMRVSNENEMHQL